MVLLAMVGVAIAFRRSRRRRFEDRVVAESAPRVAARLARLIGGPLDAEPAVAAAVPAAPMPEGPAPVAAPISYPQRARSISSALVPWSGDRAAASSSAAAALSLGPPAGPRSGESSVMTRAAMVARPSLWRPEMTMGMGSATKLDARWGIWRDASAALVAFALVALVLVGGNLLRLPPGPPPATPLAVAETTAQPSFRGVPDPVVSGPTDTPLVVITPTPAPVTPPPTPAPTPTPPYTGGSKEHQAADPTRRPAPTPTPTPHPTPTLPPLKASIVCPPSAAATVPVTCDNFSTSGPGVTYHWLVGPDGSTWMSASTSATFGYAFLLPGFYYIELVVIRDGKSATSNVAAIDISL